MPTQKLFSFLAPPRRRVMACLGILVAAASIASAALPVVGLDQRPLVTPTNALLVGFVYPLSSSTGAWFEWGTTTNYGNVTSTTNLSQSAGFIYIRLLAAPLSLDNTYFYRLVATNASGRRETAAASFIVARPANIISTARNGPQLILTFDGTPGAVYRIQAAESLVPRPPSTNVWTTIDSRTNQNGQFQFTIESIAAGTRFYRSVYP